MKNRTLVLIALCIALNMAGLGQAASTLKLPIFLDSIGNRPGGPPHGPVDRNGHGARHQPAVGRHFRPVAAAFAPVAMVIGLVAGLAARKGLFRSLAGAVIAGVVITLFVTLVATPIRTYLFGGVTGSGADFFVAYLTAVGQRLLQSVALTVIWTNLVDKIVACLVAQAVVRQLPGRIRSLSPVPKTWPERT